MKENFRDDSDLQRCINHVVSFFGPEQSWHLALESSLEILVKYERTRTHIYS